MSPIEHPSMRKAKVVSKQPAPQQETYVVDDATSEREPPVEILAESNPVTESEAPVEIEKEEEPDIPARGMLESLIFLGNASKDIEIGGMNFVINTLSHKDNTLLMKNIYNLGEGVDLFTIRTITLAYALISVNGMKIEDIPLTDAIDVTKINNMFEKKKAIINSMQRSVVEKIHDAYVVLTDEIDESLDGDQIKN